MRSDQIKLGFERAPHRGLLRATGVVGENDFNKPFIAVCNSYVDVVPGHVHLQAFGKFVKEAIRAAGGVPFEFNRSEEHTSELQSQSNLVCRLLLEKKKKNNTSI